MIADGSLVTDEQMNECVGVEGWGEFFSSFLSFFKLIGGPRNDIFGMGVQTFFKIFAN